MQAVGSLNDVQFLGHDRNRIRQLEGAAIEWPVRKWFPGFQRNQHFLQEPLIVHIAASLRKSLWSALFGPEEEIIHMEYIAVIICSKLLCQCSFSGSAVAVNGHYYSFFLAEQLPDCVLHGDQSVRRNPLLWAILYRLNALPASPTGGCGLENSVAVSPWGVSIKIYQKISPHPACALFPGNV